MWMSESEVDEAAERYALHPVLGPATQTLVNLVRWTNSNSDGWPYWQKPAKAADKLMTLIGTSVAYRVAGPERQDATMEAYRAALTPLKSFRTRYMRERNVSCDSLFEIIDREGGEEWLAEMAYADADEAWQKADYRACLAKRAREEARMALESIRARLALRDLNAKVDAGELLEPRLVALGSFREGDRLYETPVFGDNGYDGLGFAATVTGLSFGMSGARLDWVSDIHLTGNTYRPMALADAWRRWWILDATGTNLVSGGHESCERMEQLVEQYPGCVVRQGEDFIPANA